MSEINLRSAASDSTLCLCQEALQLALQLPQACASGNPDKEILDRLAQLLRQLKSVGSAGTAELATPVRMLLVKVREHVAEAGCAAERWMKAATLRMEQQARSQAMRKAYGPGRLARQR